MKIQHRVGDFIVMTDPIEGSPGRWQTVVYNGDPYCLYYAESLTNSLSDALDGHDEAICALLSDLKP